MTDEASVSNCPKTEAVIREIQVRFPSQRPINDSRYFYAASLELEPLCKNFESQTNELVSLLQQLTNAVEKHDPKNEAALRAKEYLERTSFNNSLMM